MRFFLPTQWMAAPESVTQCWVLRFWRFLSLEAINLHLYSEGSMRRNQETQNKDRLHIIAVTFTHFSIWFSAKWRSGVVFVRAGRVWSVASDVDDVMSYCDFCCCLNIFRITREFVVVLLLLYVRMLYLFVFVLTLGYRVLPTSCRRIEILSC